MRRCFLDQLRRESAWLRQLASAQTTPGQLGWAKVEPKVLRPLIRSPVSNRAQDRYRVSDSPQSPGLDQLIDHWCVDPPSKPARDLGAWRNDSSVHARLIHHLAVLARATALRRLGLHARSLAPLDPRNTCRGNEDARPPFVPPDAVARRILGQNLLDDPRAS